LFLCDVENSLAPLLAIFLLPHPLQWELTFWWGGCWQCVAILGQRGESSRHEGGSPSPPHTLPRPISASSPRWSRFCRGA